MSNEAPRKMNMKLALNIAHKAHWIAAPTAAEKLAAAKALRTSARRNPNSIHSPVYLRYAERLESEVQA
jgi:hypothetical protein